MREKEYFSGCSQHPQRGCDLPDYVPYSKQSNIVTYPISDFGQNVTKLELISLCLFRTILKISGKCNQIEVTKLDWLL